MFSLVSVFFGWLGQMHSGRTLTPPSPDPGNMANAADAMHPTTSHFFYLIA